MRPRQFMQAVVLAVAMFGAALGSATAEDCSGKGKRACEVHETPYVAALPFVTMVGVAALYVLQRCRASREDEDGAVA